MYVLVFKDIPDPLGGVISVVCKVSTVVSVLDTEDTVLTVVPEPVDSETSTTSKFVFSFIRPS